MASICPLFSENVQVDLEETPGSGCTSSRKITTLLYKPKSKSSNQSIIFPRSAGPFSYCLGLAIPETMFPDSSKATYPPSSPGSMPINNFFVSTLSKLFILFIKFNFISQNIYSNRVKRQPTTNYLSYERITEYFSTYSYSSINISINQFISGTLE